MRNPSRQEGVVRTTVVRSGSYNSAVAATGASSTYLDLVASSDFTSFASLYRTFRVVAMEIQFLDLQPTSPIAAVIGTGHVGGTLVTPSVAYVQDLPDAVNVKPYQQHVLHWRPRNPSERIFLDTTTGLDYGGFFLWSLGGTAVSNKWRYLVRYVVEFKDRI
jgi:hypothetical protein